jgi:REP element-mobilizing transposase RayT
MQYNPKIHHRRSIRLQGYDYSQAGLYFLTLNTHDRKCLFGEIIEQKMILNDAGRIAENCWLEIPLHFPNAVLHEYIIMPDHIHGIVELNEKIDLVGAENSVVGAENSVVGAENFLPRRNEFQKMIPRSISSIVKGFKIGVTKWFRSQGNSEIIWQRNFYEHIIRNDNSYQHISDYILSNPTNWKDDQINNE